jgi:hypothetical protein
MGLHLDAADRTAFARDGFLFPISVLTAHEVDIARRSIETFESELGGPLPKELRRKLLHASLYVLPKTKMLFVQQRDLLLQRI